MPLHEFEQIFPVLCKRLKQAKAKGRTGQAYLLVGDDVEFLEKFAYAWAQTAACLSPNPDGSACGHCQCCTLFKNNAYPELHTIRPQSKSRTITVDDMRDFEHVISLSTPSGFLKIGMLVEAERLNTSSQNAFLKTLEEPPQNTMLLLLTVSPRTLLPTTKSRCQTISLLRNKQDYSQIAEQGLFKYISLLKRQAGASAGIKAAAGIAKILTAQHANAEEIIQSQKDSNWDKVEDPKIRKQLEEERKAKIEAEYVRLRNIVTSAIQAWFLQRMLIASDADSSLLPNPEILKDAPCPKVPMEEAVQDIKYVADFLKALSGNVDEKIALDAMCLSISEKHI